MGDDSSTWVGDEAGSSSQTTPIFSIEETGAWGQDDQIQAQYPNPNFPRGPYVRGTILGTGGWCAVYKVRRVRDGVVAAGKASGDARARKKLREEAHLLKSLNHSHILNYVDFYADDSAALLVTELCAGGTLQTKINNSPEGIGRRETLLAILQCSQALQYVHNRNYFHSDVKPRNILIRTWNPVNIVLADWADMKPRAYFGKAAGTMAFWSPDVVNSGLSMGASDDMWALGISVLGMIAQLPRLDAQKHIREHQKACSSHAQKLLELNPDDKVIRMLIRMLTEKLEFRATSSQCVDQAAAVLEELKEENMDNALAIVTPPDFQGVSFW